MSEEKSDTQILSSIAKAMREASTKEELEKKIEEITGEKRNWRHEEFWKKHHDH